MLAATIALAGLYGNEYFV